MDLNKLTDVGNKKDIFAEAIKRCEWKIVCDAILNESVSPDCLNARQAWSLLRFSVEFNNLPTFKKLIDEKINLNPYDASSLLWIAVTRGHTAEIGSELVRLGADLTRRRLGCTLLQKLAMKCNEPKNVQLAILMLDRGADMNALHGRYHKCAFYYAVQKKCEILIKEFLDRGAHVRYYLLLGLYQYREERTMFNLFDKALNIYVEEEIRNKRLISLLWDLARFPDECDVLEKFKEVLASGVSSDELNKNSQMFVNLMRDRKFEMADRLLEYGFDGDLKQCTIQSALVGATTYENANITKWLINKGADVNVYCLRSEIYPLLSACLNSSVDNVKILLENGANINFTNRYGLNPYICIPLRIGSLIIKQVALLVNRGAEVDKRYFEKISYHPIAKTLYNNYFTELQNMKRTLVFPGIDLFSILTNVNLASFTVRNPTFMKNYEDLKTNTAFPLFCQDLSVALNKAAIRKSTLIHQEEAFVGAIFNILPYLVIEKILFYFYFSDIN